MICSGHRSLSELPKGHRFNSLHRESKWSRSNPSRGLIALDETSVLPRTLLDATVAQDGQSNGCPSIPSSTNQSVRAPQRDQRLHGSVRRARNRVSARGEAVSQIRWAQEETGSTADRIASLPSWVPFVRALEANRVGSKHHQFPSSERPRQRTK